MLMVQRKMVSFLSTHSEQVLGTAPIAPLLLRMAVPAITAQLVNMLYSVVDRIFISHIPGVGNLALTAVGITFPIAMLLAAFASFAGSGGAPLASIQLGAQNKPEAERIMGNSLIMLLSIGAVATVLWLSKKKAPPSDTE